MKSATRATRDSSFGEAAGPRDVTGRRVWSRSGREVFIIYLALYTGCVSHLSTIMGLGAGGAAGDSAGLLRVRGYWSFVTDQCIYLIAVSDQRARGQFPVSDV